MGQASPIPKELDALAREAVDAAFAVHRGLGPGLLEQVYERCLVYELGKRGVTWERQVAVPIHYDGVRLESQLRTDVLVGGSLVVEVKAIERNLPVHRAQLLTYLKLTGHRLGLLINFNVPMLKEGITRVGL